jgi:hypothetical protein
LAILPQTDEQKVLNKSANYADLFSQNAQTKTRQVFRRLVMYFRQQQLQPDPVQIVTPEPTKELKFRRNLTKVSNFLGWVGVGTLATTMVGICPAYWGLYALSAGLGTVGIILFPGDDKSFQFYSALSFIVGLILPWWGLVYLIKPIHVAGAIALMLVIVFLVGAIGGGQ